MSRIMIVDDELSVRTVLLDYLGRRGYKTIAAESGPMALNLLKGFRPNIILLDIKMPGMDGLETLKKLKEQSPDTVVIMLTAENEPEVGKSAMVLGADDYITKPFSFEQLETNLSVHLLLLFDD